MTPQETVDIKQIADGVEVNVGTVDVRNALLISDSGEDARFVGTLINNSGSDRTVTIEVKGDQQTVQVPANSHVDLGSKAGSSKANSSVESSSGSKLGTRSGQGTQTVVFDGVRITPGSLVKVYFSYGSKGASVAVPVLTGQQQEYAHLVPTGTPTPSATPGSEVTLPVETPSATATPSN